MQSISANLNIMIKAAEKASKALIRDFGEIEKLQVSVKGPKDFFSNAMLRFCGPTQPFMKNYQNGTFSPMHGIQNFGPFEVLKKCHFVILSKMCLRLRPCAYLGG